MGVTNEVLSRVYLDDLELVDGVCPPDLTCNFDDESQSCKWDNYFPEGATLPWSFGSGSENISSAPGYAVTLFGDEEHLSFITGIGIMLQKNY